MVWIDHNLFIHSLVGGYLGCLEISSITNRATMIVTLFLLGKYLKWLGHIVGVCFTFKKLPNCLFKVVVPLYIPNSNVLAF